MGPLAGFRVIEMAGIGPGPFAAMLLADMGAEVIRVERPGGGAFSGDRTELDFLNRGKRCLCVNLKESAGVELVLKLVAGADALLEGFRPGVMEKLGLSPDRCRELNPRLVYGRMTGWGQQGPLASRAGHDINYIAIAGALHPIGRAGEKPVIPLNLLGDFAGGGMLLAYGVVCALLEAAKSGRGQVVDAAMVDGAALLMTSIFAAAQAGFWSERRGTNMLDGGAHFYEVYETADGGYMAVGAIEGPFYAEFLHRLGLDGEALPNQFDTTQWPAMKERIQAAFLARGRDEWCEIFADCDACVTPVLSMSEAHAHPHNRARETFVEREGIWQPYSAPRFSRSDPGAPRRAVPLGADTRAILEEQGYSRDAIEDLLASGVVRGAD